MTQHEETELRKFALDQATNALRDDADSKRTVDRANAYYEFLKGEQKPQGA